MFIWTNLNTFFPVHFHSTIPTVSPRFNSEAILPPPTPPAFSGLTDQKYHPSPDSCDHWATTSSYLNSPAHSTLHSMLCICHLLLTRWAPRGEGLCLIQLYPEDKQTIMLPNFKWIVGRISMWATEHRWHYVPQDSNLENHMQKVGVSRVLLPQVGQHFRPHPGLLNQNLHFNQTPLKMHLRIWKSTPLRQCFSNYRL